jgi:hypothetical protein
VNSDIAGVFLLNGWGVMGRKKFALKSRSAERKVLSNFVVHCTHEVCTRLAHDNPIAF